MSAPTLRTQGLSRRWGLFDANKDITLTLEPGARHALIGPNGAGKTTFINLLTGALAPTAGRVFLGAEDITGLPQHLRVKRGMTRTFQINTLFGGLTVLESVLLAICERQGLAFDMHHTLASHRAETDEAMALLETLKLTGDANAPTRTLAYGRQRLVEIALGLATRPQVLLLDEPAAGIPAAESAELFEAIAHLPRSVTILFIEHTHAYDPTLRAMRRTIASGLLGRVGMMTTFNYTDFLYRPRRPEELDTSRGGGVVFNQLPHQIDLLRMLGGGMVRSIRASCTTLDPARPTEGSVVAFLDFADGAAASLVYSGYDFFDSDTLHGWVGEGGHPKPPHQNGSARRALALRDHDGEAALRRKQLAYGALPLPPGAAPHPPHFGTTIVTGERGELKSSPAGLTLFDVNGAHDIPLPSGSGYQSLFADLRSALRAGVAPRHDGRWGKATVETLLALLQSARERREIVLSHQVPLPYGV